MGHRRVVSADIEQAIIHLHVENYFALDSSTKLSVCSFLHKDSTTLPAPPQTLIGRDAKTH